MIADRVVTVTGPASAALTTLDTVKARLGISGSGSDTQLTAGIALASAILADACRRRLGAQTLAETFRVRVANVTATRDLERHGLVLNHPDAAVTGVTVDGDAVGAGTYEVEGGIVWPLTTEGTRTTWPGTSIVVTYTTGYSLPGSAPPVLAEYCISLVLAWFRAGDRTGADVRSETTEGVGSVSYFDRGTGAMVIDDTMTAGLGPYRRVSL